MALASNQVLAEPIKAPHLEVELISESSTLARGAEPNWVALRLEPEPGWHVYWINPGDSGLATTLEWSLPAGVTAGPIEWPYPHAEDAGGLTNYGYGEEVLHLVPITVAPDWPAGKPVPLRVEAKWLVCQEVCIPGKAQLALDLPVSDRPQPDPKWAAMFAKTRAALPRQEPGWQARFTAADGTFTLKMAGTPKTAERVEFFPEPNDLVDHAAPQRLAVGEDGTLLLSQALSTYFVSAPAEVRGVLVLHEGEKVHAVQIRATPVSIAAPGGETTSTASSGGESKATGGKRPALGFALLSALLGGLVLNLMPCVFPILSLKALAVVRSREQSAAAARTQGLLYTAGVIVTFAVIAGLLLALRAGGQAMGWGFQLQSAKFLGFLVYLLFALGLSLSGVVHFGLRWGALGQGLTQQSGPKSDFFTGVLAVVVASPCTAPFMGTALGYALTQNPATAILIFVVLGLGLALPFLLLGFFPRLGAWLPKPGAWMETFKQAMAFPLYLTVVWLLWVLARQAGADAVALVLVGLVLVSFALWLWHQPRPLARVLKVGALALAALLLLSPMLSASNAPATATRTGSEPWSEERVAELRAQGRTVFVDFTADWCLTCKVNERVALSSDAVETAFQVNDVAFLVADWTKSDPAITGVLEGFGHPGVPLYLVYVKGGEPKVLPQLLTPAIVIDSLEP